MGNPLPVQEPTMDEILASIRRIIEGREERPDALADLSAALSDAEAAPADPDAPRAGMPSFAAAPEASSSVVPHSSTNADTTPSAADMTGGNRVERPSGEAGRTQPARHAVNDEGKLPFGGHHDDAMAKDVASKVEELATVSVARMRAASLESAVRDQRGAQARAEGGVGESDEPQASALPTYSDEFDEIAFASELLASAGIVEERDAENARHAALAATEDTTPAPTSSSDKRPSLALVTALSEPEKPIVEAHPNPTLEAALNAVSQAGSSWFGEIRPAGEAGSAREDLSDGEATVAAGSTGQVSSTPVAEAMQASQAAREVDAATPAFDETPNTHAPRIRAASPTPEPMLSLISNEVETRISSSFGELAEVIRTEQLERLDDTVRDLLRPMLSDWLEDNLPKIVETLVREEIERVARGPRRN